MFTSEGDSCVYNAALAKLWACFSGGIFKGEMGEEAGGGTGVWNRAIEEVSGGAVDYGYNGVMDVRSVLCQIIKLN